jgi:hypothetical protein
MNDFVKWWTIAMVVMETVNQFIKVADPASISPATVASESAKTLERQVAQGFLSPAVLDGHNEIINSLVDAHPQIKMLPKAENDRPKHTGNK